jgi:hypothetical protein
MRGTHRNHSQQQYDDQTRELFHDLPSGIMKVRLT